MNQRASRMLKSSASFVPCLRRSGFAQAGRIAQILNVEEEFLGAWKHWRGFSVRKIHSMGERPHKVRSVPPPDLRLLRPCWTNLLSLLHDLLPLS